MFVCTNNIIGIYCFSLQKRPNWRPATVNALPSIEKTKILQPPASPPPPEVVDESNGVSDNGGRSKDF
jgi:hypothetical protein